MLLAYSFVNIPFALLRNMGTRGMCTQEEMVRKENDRCEIIVKKNVKEKNKVKYFRAKIRFNKVVKILCQIVPDTDQYQNIKYHLLALTWFL